MTIVCFAVNCCRTHTHAYTRQKMTQIQFNKGLKKSSKRKKSSNEKGKLLPFASSSKMKNKSENFAVVQVLVVVVPGPQLVLLLPRPHCVQHKLFDIVIVSIASFACSTSMCVLVFVFVLVAV